MPKRARISAKKQPQQSRSKATVEALLESTARVLARDGYDRASTNRIAEVAGVNIGSLYQYFPSKEALIAALIDRHLEQIRALCTELLESPSSIPFPDMLRTIVERYLQFHAANPALHRVLLEQVPRVERLNPIVALRRRLIEITRSLLETRRSEVPVSNPARAAFMTVHLVDALTQAALLERPEYLTDKRYLDDLLEAVQACLENTTRAP